MGLKNRHKERCVSTVRTAYGHQCTDTPILTVIHFVPKTTGLCLVPGPAVAVDNDDYETDEREDE